MEFACRRVDALPPLAWCARLEHGASAVALTHGAWVETNRDVFVEGAWEGAYTEGGVDCALLLMGSGGRIRDRHVVFATASHNLERLHLLERGRSLFISNSLPFLLAAADAELDTAYADYQVDLWSVMHGLDRCKTQIPTRGGPLVRLFYFCNVEIDAGLGVTPRPKPLPPSWTTYAEYRHFLVQGLAALAANASAPQRRIRYAFLATISSGYDSSASTALAVEAGCRRAVTFGTGFRYFDRHQEVADSGAAIAECLGLEARELSLHAHLAHNGDAPAEFASCGDAFDAHLAGLEDELPMTLLLTGVWGDRVWNRLNKDEVTRLVRGDPSGTGLGEFRLRVGFIHVPVPFFGAMALQAIRAISRRPEMEPWTLGNDYDRPIARRILEEAGVPREMFGQTKQGAFATLAVTRGNASRFPSFEAFYLRHWGERGLVARGRAEFRYYVQTAARLWTRAADRYGLPRVLPRVTPWDVVVPGRRSLLVQWGNAVMRQRYRSVLGLE